MITSQELIQYKNTDDMEELKLMLKNDSIAYEAWFPLAEKYAKEMANGKPLLMDVIVNKHVNAIESSAWRIARRYQKQFGRYLECDQYQRMAISWQWFYNLMMDAYTFFANRKNGGQVI